MALDKGMRFIRSATQSWKLDLGLIAVVSAAIIQDHIGHDGEHGGLPVPEGIEERCDTMEIWGSCVDPFTGERSEDPVVWELVFKKGRDIVAEVSRPDPETPDVKAVRLEAEAKAAAEVPAVSEVSPTPEE